MEIPTEKRSLVSPLIRERWSCPLCRASALQEENRSVRCNSCRETFKTYRGIPLFIRNEFQDRQEHDLYKYDLAVIVLALNERRNIQTLLVSLKNTLQRMGITWQLVVVDGGSTDGTPDEARSQGAAVVIQKERGYGRALIEGFRVGQGRYILTMDADLSHPAEFVEELWRQRAKGDLLVASRYVPGARFEAPMFRKVLSRILNFVFWRVLSLPVKDVSSGFRLYHAEALHGLSVEGRNFEVLEELLIRIFMNGWAVSEIPFNYAPRQDGTSKARLFSFGLCLWVTLRKMRRLRRSGISADHEDRVFSSLNPFRRFGAWASHRTVLGWVRKHGGALLAIGYGSRRFYAENPSIVGVDSALHKLRHLRGTHEALLLGNSARLPFVDGAFGTVICSWSTDAFFEGDKYFNEVARVVEDKGKVIVIAPKSISRDKVQGILENAGFKIVNQRSLLGAGVHVLARKINHDAMA